MTRSWTRRSPDAGNGRMGHFLSGAAHTCGGLALLVLVSAGSSLGHRLAASADSEHLPAGGPDSELVPDAEAGLLRAPVGGDQLLECELDFPFNHRIPYHLQWDKDGEEIYSWYSGSEEGQGVEAVGKGWQGRVERADNGGSLRLRGLRGADGGEYRCRVAFPNRSPPARRAPTVHRLRVVGDDLIAAPPSNATVLEGERVELTCTPRDGELTVQWSKDDAPLEEAKVAANGSLVLSGARAADGGHYRCSVTAPEGTVHVASAHLDVQYPAKVVHAPPERRLPLGRPASLDCHFAANPPLTNLRWEKDGFLFDPYNVPGVFYSRNGSLLFNRVDEEHEGAYSCTPYNALGSAGPAPPVRVRVLRPPELAARPQPLYVARLGGAVTLPCLPRERVDGPAPDVRWARADGLPLPPARHALSGGNLTLGPLTAADGGRYLCTASNAAASVAAAAELRIENAPPRAPRRLAALASPERIRVTWAAGEAAEEADAAYEVWWREAGAAEWRALRLLSRAATSATLLSLRPDTSYELRVLQTDRLGDGLFSRPLLVRTPSEEEGGVTEAFEAPPDDGDGDATPSDSEALRVLVRQVDEGLLVRWERGDGASVGPCELTVRADGRQLQLAGGGTDVQRQYALVSGEGAAEGALEGTLEGTLEGKRVTALVRCGQLRGLAVLHVPAYARLRAVAAGCAAAALALAVLATAAVTLLRRRRRAR